MRPVADDRRIVSLDVLRGAAVLGILVMNIQAFAMPGSAYLNPTTYGDLNGLNFVVWLAGHLLVDEKFMAIFCMLFGAGIWLMAHRAEESGRRPALLHYRRMVWLTVFGLLHAHLLWSGDILFDYGLCGLVVYPLRNLKPTRLVATGLVGLVIGSGIMVGYGRYVAQLPAATVRAVEREVWRPGPFAQANELRAYRGGWQQQMAARRSDAIFSETTLFLYWGLWRETALMLVGIALLRWGVLGGAPNAARDRWLLAAAIGLGIPIVTYGTWRDFASNWSFPYSFFFGALFNYWGSLPIALGWIALVGKVARVRAFGRGAARLAAVGRMAFTNYILQTVICTTVFYGHGLGWFGSVTRTGQFAVVLAVWSVLLVLSPIWLRHFCYGPLEWLWRTLTYWRRQPFRRGQDRLLGGDAGQ